MMKHSAVCKVCPLIIAMVAALIAVPRLVQADAQSELEKKADMICEAWISGDYYTYTSFLFPPLVERMGGRHA
ncbi:MAG: hypothetical protein EOL87_07335 [Spartobacteria bacterium]|nr:hypothetical protein [Spartobacteria bacterium]